jgi:hypothetical protein
LSTAKRSGARDISELKARLGLKKKGSGTAPTSDRGAVPPPGRRSGAVPSPPGAAPPRPHIPDASEDPFGAMNALAAHGTASAAPSIVVVNDGRPVESVEDKGASMRLVKIGGILVIPLILGMVVGQVASEAKAHNHSVDDASALAANVEQVGKQLLAVQQVLQVAKERGQKEGKPWYKLNDPQLVKDLQALEPLSPDLTLLEKVYLHKFNEKFVEQLLPFYAETVALQKALREHVKQSVADQKVIEEGATKLGKFSPRAYAGLLETPSPEEAQSGKPVMFKLVQLGLPICEANGKPSADGCSALPAEFQYRISESGQWGTRKVSGSEIASGGLVFFNPDTEFFRGILKGGGASVAEAAYMERLENIDQKVEALVGVRKFLLQVLNNKKQQSKQFTFFL